MIFVFFQLLFSSCIDQCGVLARQTLIELLQKHPLPEEEEAQKIYTEHLEIFEVATETIRTIDQTDELPDLQKILEMMLVKADRQTYPISPWIRKIVEEKAGLILRANNEKISYADLLDAFFKGESLVSCAKVSAHGAKDAHEIVNYIHDIFHTLLFYRAQVVLMYWIQDQMYKDSWLITKTIGMGINSKIPRCCACCFSEPSEEEQKIAETGINRYKEMMNFLKLLADSDPKAQAALFWFLHETNVWKSDDFDETDYAALLKKWKERAVFELNRPQSWQKKHTEANGFGFVRGFDFYDEYQMELMQKIKKKLEDCSIHPTDELIHDHVFWTEAGDVLLHSEKREKAEAYIQETFKLKPPYTIEKLREIENLGLEIWHSYSEDCISERAEKAGVTLTPEQIHSQEFGKELYYKFYSLDKTEEMEGLVSKLLQKLGIANLCVLPQNFWEKLKSVHSEIVYFNNIRLGLTDQTKEFQKDRALKLQRKAEELERLDLKVLSETTNFRKVQVYGNQIFYLPTDRFLHQNAWDIYRILKYTAGVTDLQSPKEVKAERLAEYLDLLGEHLIGCFDHLIEKASQQQSTTTMSASVGADPLTKKQQ